MNKDKIEKVTELFEALIDLEVRFYYESETVPNTEILSIEVNEDGTITIDGFDNEEYIVEIEDFIDNYSKEGMNYHSWNLARNFDDAINDL